MSVVNAVKWTAGYGVLLQSCNPKLSGFESGLKADAVELKRSSRGWLEAVLIRLAVHRLLRVGEVVVERF